MARHILRRHVTLVLDVQLPPMLDQELDNITHAPRAHALTHEFKEPKARVPSGQ